MILDSIVERLFFNMIGRLLVMLGFWYTFDVLFNVLIQLANASKPFVAIFQGYVAL